MTQWEKQCRCRNRGSWSQRPHINLIPNTLPSADRQVFGRRKKKGGNKVFKKETYLEVNCHLVLKLAFYVIITFSLQVRGTEWGNRTKDNLTFPSVKNTYYLQTGLFCELNKKLGNTIFKNHK